VPKPKTYSLRLIHYTSIPLVPTMPYPTSTWMSGLWHWPHGQSHHKQGEI
jgi:hypothetical protein